MTVARPCLYERIYQGVQDHIFSGDLKRGDILPSILDLSNKYGVAVNTIRTAFEMLQKDGYIRSVKKKGTVVICEDLPGEAIARHLVVRRESYMGVCSMLRLLAPDMLRFGAGRCMADEIEKMERIVETVDTGLSAKCYLLQWDLFLCSMIAPTKNDLFRNLLKEGNRFLRFPLSLLESGDFVFASGVQSNMHALLHAVKSGDMANVRSIILEWYTVCEKKIEDYLNGISGSQAAEDESVPFFWMIRKSSHLLYSSIAANLSQNICTGEYLYGSYLPSQTQMQEENGVSLSSVRNALSVLSSMGVVQYDSGKGYLITSDDWNFSAWNPGLSQYAYSQALQMMMLTIKAVANEVYPYMDHGMADAFCEKDKALYGTVAGSFYSPCFLLIHKLLERLHGTVTRGVYQQLLQEMMLGCYGQKTLQAFFPAHFARLHEDAVEAIHFYRASEREAFMNSMETMLMDLGSLSRDLFGMYHLPECVPLPTREAV